AGVEHDVVDGHVHGVLHQRRLDLVGAADQDVRALDALVHVDDVVLGLAAGRFAIGDGRRRGGLARLVVRGDDGVALDFPVDLHGHWGGSSALYVLVWVSGSRRGRWLPRLDGGAGVLPGLLRLDHGLLRGAGGGG